MSKLIKVCTLCSLVYVDHISVKLLGKITIFKRRGMRVNDTEVFKVVVPINSKNRKHNITENLCLGKFTISARINWV